MDLFALRSGGGTGLHQTVYCFEMHVAENRASRSSAELHSTKSSLYLLKYVLETFSFYHECAMLLHRVDWSVIVRV